MRWYSAYALALFLSAMLSNAKIAAAAHPALGTLSAAHNIIRLITPPNPPPPKWHPTNKVTKSLISNDSKLNEPDAYGHSPLYHAARRGHVVLADALIARGAKVDTADPWGWSPLHVAAYRGHRAVAELLISKGASIEARDHWGQTPLQLATFKKHRATCNILRSYGARY